jgi:hypothetical protein
MPCHSSQGDPTAVTVDQSEPSLVDPLAGIGQQLLQLLRLSPSELRYVSEIWDYELRWGYNLIFWESCLPLSQ